MINLSFYYRNNTTLEQRITTLSVNHQILSPYTAFVGVETTASKTNNTPSKVRHVPIQISKGDEHLFNYLAMPSYSYGMAPMAMGGRGGPPMSYSMAYSPPGAARGYRGQMYAYAQPPQFKGGS